MTTLMASKQQHARQFSEEILKSGDGLRQDRVDGAVLDILGNQARRRHDREQRRQNAHRAERDIFQDLKFLLEGKLGHEDRVADQEQREKKHDVKGFQAGQLGKRIPGDRRDSSDGKGAVSGRDSSGLWTFGVFRRLRGFEKEPLERGPGPALFEQARARLCGQRLDFAEQRRRRIFENEVGAIFDREQIGQGAFADQDPVRENAHAIANLLHLFRADATKAARLCRAA